MRSTLMKASSWPIDSSSEDLAFRLYGKTSLTIHATFLNSKERVPLQGETSRCLRSECGSQGVNSNFLKTMSSWLKSKALTKNAVILNTLPKALGVLRRVTRRFQQTKSCLPNCKYP